MVSSTKECVSSRALRSSGVSQGKTTPTRPGGHSLLTGALVLLSGSGTSSAGLLLQCHRLSTLGNSPRATWDFPS